MEIFSVKNKVVFITGSSRGVGREIAMAFLKLKAVVIGVSRNENKSIKHKNYYHLVCDLKNYQALKHTANQAFKIKKKIDVIINNAGITKEEQNNFYKSFKSFNKEGKAESEVLRAIMSRALQTEREIRPSSLSKSCIDLS